jgi:hypothetical protein
MLKSVTDVARKLEHKYAGYGSPYPAEVYHLIKRMFNEGYTREEILGMVEEMLSGEKRPWLEAQEPVDDTIPTPAIDEESMSAVASVAQKFERKLGVYNE